MPLPKPPAKRAALLAAADFESPGRARTGKRRAADRSPPAEPVAAGAARPVRPTAPTPPAPPARGGRAPRRERRRRQRRAPSRAPRKPRGTGPAKLFVLDTNVLMHDPTSLFRFEEHDIYLPMITLEELDGHKRGMTEVARNARQVSRDARRAGRRHAERATPSGIRRLPLNAPATARPAASCSSRPTCSTSTCRPGLPQGKADNQILGVVQGAARAAAEARRGAGVQGHQHAHQGARARPARRGLLQRQDARRRRPALHRRAAAAGRLLGAPRQDDGELAAGRPHLLPHQPGRWCRRC